jgi:hypothetical protein
MSVDVGEQEILDALHRVPRERWGDVLRFLDSLKAAEAVEPPSRRVLTGKDLAESDLIGIWADRTDIGDSREFARRLREQAQRRGRGD